MGPYVYLTRSILPSMLKREKRSGIIFTSSIAATAYALPGLSTYSATKAFNDSFARSLAYEVYEKVDVLSFKPAQVKTNMNRSELKFSVLTPEEAANGALDKLGWDIETEGHWRHVVSTAKVRIGRCFMPECFVRTMISKRMRAASIRIKENRQKKE